MIYLSVVVVMVNTIPLTEGDSMPHHPINAFTQCSDEAIG